MIRVNDAEDAVQLTTKYFCVCNLLNVVHLLVKENRVLQFEGEIDRRYKSFTTHI